MHKYNLGFISDEDIYNHVKETVESYRREITLSQFNENVIDPIKLTFDAKVYSKTVRQAVEDECFRQIDKSNTNKIGYFHQNIFKYAGNGWVVPSAGFDVENDERHIYANLTNKYITMNSESLRTIYMQMQMKLIEDRNSMCYIVDYTTNKSIDDSWKIILLGKQYEHNRIRKISIDRLYSIVFEDDRALVKINKALPMVIDDVLQESPELLIIQ